MRLVLLLIVAAFVGVLAWKKRDEIPFLREAQTQIPKEFKFDNGSDKPLPPLPPPLSEAKDSAAAGVRRCVVDGKTLYTSDPCPKGAVEHQVKGGNISVYTPPKPPEQKSSGIPNVRDLAGPKLDLQDKMIERAERGH